MQAKDLVGIGSDESKDSSISREEKWQEKSRVDKDNEHGRLAVTNPHKYHPTEKMSAISSQKQILMEINEVTRLALSIFVLIPLN